MLSCHQPANFYPAWNLQQSTYRQERNRLLKESGMRPEAPFALFPI
jgi:hypothetical protein